MDTNRQSWSHWPKWNVEFIYKIASPAEIDRLFIPPEPLRQQRPAPEAAWSLFWVLKVNGFEDQLKFKRVQYNSGIQRDLGHWLSKWAVPKHLECINTHVHHSTYSFHTKFLWKFRSKHLNHSSVAIWFDPTTDAKDVKDASVAGQAVQLPQEEARTRPIEQDQW